MAFEKNTPESVKRFDAIAAVPKAKRGLLFGCPVYLLGDERYATLFENRFVLRLSTEDAEALLARGGTVFEPLKGRKSKRDRVVVPEAIAKNTRALKAWVAKAVAFAR